MLEVKDQFMQLYSLLQASLFPVLDSVSSDNLCWGFMAQLIQWGHVERGQFT